MTNLSQQIPFTSSMISPPPSPPEHSNVIPSTIVCESSSTDAVGSTEKQAIPTSQPPQPEKIANPKSKFRMFVSEIPPELLDLIKNSEIKNKKTNEVKIKTTNVSKSKPSHHITGSISELRTVLVKILIQSNLLLNHHRASPLNLITPSLTSLSSSSDSTPPSSPTLFVQKKQRRGHIKTKGSKLPTVERKRKSNSLSRVMADRGLLETSFDTANSDDVKSIRLPPPPPMEWEKLFENINNMHLDMEILNDITPKITWKGQPLSISHLPHFNALHPKEIMVASTLRLTPVQYLTAKNTLVSAAQRYAQRSLPFRKSDAQKLLRIDVNKASKLWEFFQQVKWI
ncbi:9300_t:CDS:2 [Acaulospora colombiana]|uniref:9300_t:CDS:1 n=1 Tax=Acaulospora colombiana TaxID=27376 RepID=A0ACA9MKF8_9GLOM|nr:9300_t:CDS:2 [Acaulospora colombiana]